MFHAIFDSFLLVAVSEMGDKTQLLAFSLAIRFKKPWTVMTGILTATLLNHALASWAGEWVSRAIRGDIMSYILSASFVAFGIWTLFPDRLEESDKPHRFGPFLTTTLLFFLAEMGDKTQLATVALGARFQSAVAVTAGTTLGMMVTDSLAVFLGEQLAERVQMKWIRRAAAGIFFAFGLWSLWAAVTWKG